VVALQHRDVFATASCKGFREIARPEVFLTAENPNIAWVTSLERGDDLEYSVGRGVFSDDDFIVERRALHQGAGDRLGDEILVLVRRDQHAHLPGYNRISIPNHLKYMTVSSGPSV